MKHFRKPFRDNVREWGLAKDEYIDNGNFPRQVYVREGRRLHGEHFFTANDAYPVAKGNVPLCIAIALLLVIMLLIHMLFINGRKVRLLWTDSLTIKRRSIRFLLA